MSRAAGRNTPRPPVTEGEKREAGATEADRVIPGGLTHMGNPPVKTQAVPVPAADLPYRRAMLAHGVIPDGQHHDRDPRLSGGQRGQARTEPPPEAQQSPVPVVIVERHWRDRPQASCDTRRITCPVAGGEPVMICGANPARSLVQLLNEDSTHQARFGQLEQLVYDAQNAVVTGGARVPAGATGYTVFRSQDELYITSETSSTVVVSVILESEEPGTGG